MTHYGMAIDLTRCFGCHACEVACKVANNNPADVAYNKIYNVGAIGETEPVAYDTASGTYPNCSLSFLPMNCQHCENPSCLEVCPTGATMKDEETGVVYVDDTLCIGCKSCISACPYEGVRTLVSDEPEWFQDVAVGEFDAPAHLGNTVEKCTFCRNLTSRGEVPACMQLCPGRARFWGDLDDPESDVSKLIASRDTMRLSEDAGTSPSVYYLV